MNKIILIGNLTKDPEIRVTQSGKKVASFSIAVNEGKSSTGQDLTQYFNLTAWDRKAEIAEMYLKKGHKIAIVGRLQNRSWTKPDGTKAYATDVVIGEMEMLTSKVDADRINAQTAAEAPASSTNTPAAKPAQAPQAVPEIDINSDDLDVQMPF